MSKPGGAPSSGISLGDVLRRPKRHPACRRRETHLDDRFHEGGNRGTDDLLADSSFAVSGTRSGIMARWRQAVEAAMTDEEIGSLTVLSRSRTEPASRVERARMLLAYRGNPSFFSVGQRLGVHHQTVQR